MQLRILLILALCFLGLLFACTSGKIEVDVENLDLTEKLDITISYSGGEEKISKLNTGETYTFNIHPKHESSIVVQFYNNEGKKIEKDIDVYFEKSYRGEVIIRIESDDKIDVSSNIHL